LDRLWAPWRMGYIKSAKDEKECIFCEAANAQDLRSRYVLLKGKLSFIIMNLYPYNNGHLMVSPIRHTASLTDLTDEELLEMMRHVKLSVKVIKQSLNPDGFNVGLNLGRVAGAGIEDHLHVHVVPRWRGDTNFMTVISETRVLPETIDQSYEKLLNAIRSSDG
jgi:ATP adenylyltransferase